MRTASSAQALPQSAAWQSWLRDLAVTVKWWWVGYMIWRIEQAAIAQLCSLSDRELKDIGITRSEILSAVKFQPARDRSFHPFY
jgi:uncharacterized protein YjiS (DUF1127 family)